MPGPDMPGALRDHCQVNMGSSVYVLGGTAGSSGASSLVFVLELGVWRAISSMRDPRSSLACIAHDGSIYAIGGYDPNAWPAYLSTVEVYNPGSDTWQPGPVLPSPLANAQVINHQGIIYLIGGASDVNNNKVFTLSEGMWQVLTEGGMDLVVEAFPRKIYPAPVLSADILFCASNNQ